MEEGVLLVDWVDIVSGWLLGFKLVETENVEMVRLGA
jgi:hypothetical protein